MGAATMKQKPEFEITPIPAGMDPMKFFEQMIHDCPECQAARARGEEPQIVVHGVPPANESRQVRRARERKLRRARY